MGMRRKEPSGPHHNNAQYLDDKCITGRLCDMMDNHMPPGSCITLHKHTPWRTVTPQSPHIPQPHHHPTPQNPPKPKRGLLTDGDPPRLQGDLVPATQARSHQVAPEHTASDSTRHACGGEGRGEEEGATNICPHSMHMGYLPYYLTTSPRPHRVAPRTPAPGNYIIPPVCSSAASS